MTQTEVPLKAEDFLPGTRYISNSEVTAYLSCKRQYDFAFIENLAPKEPSEPLQRGTLGHSAFEFYINRRLDGASHEKALKASESVFMEAMSDGIIKIDTVMQTQHIFFRYMNFHNGWPKWKLLGTETRVDLRITETLGFPIRYDLLIEEIATGAILIGDWKFTFDFWSDNDHSLNPQMPKYISVLQANGQRCDGGFIEEIRTRNLGKEKAADHRNLWRRTTYFPGPLKKKEFLRQHVAASLSIERHRALTPEQREDESIPVYNKFGACKYCNFKDLCIAMTEGARDLSVDIRTGYEQNEYALRYNPEELNF